MPKTVLAILAGGLSRRYQKQNTEWQDKILFQFNNEPFLVNLIKRSNLLYDETVLSVNSTNREEAYKTILQKHSLANQIDFIIDDQNSSFEGVMLGIGSILRSLRGKVVQVLPSDRPFLMLSILKSMKICDEGVSFFQSDTGLIEPLLTLYGSNIYFPRELETLSLSRADVLMRVSPLLKIYNADTIISMNDLSPRTFSNVNVQDYIKNDNNFNISEEKNLTMPPPITISRSSPIEKQGSFKEIDCQDYVEKLNEQNHNYSAFLWSMFFRNQSLINEGNYNCLAKKSLRAEHQFWTDKKIPFFALHALQDLLFFFPEEKIISDIQKIDALKKQMKIQSKTVTKLNKLKKE
ncbi:MAG: NTP transferase domain-containing protein [Candidatus Heimdallarchaeota archaeon]|nr:NTP transferase domain-containing protein [Candidatus Heimdallarchaeota archaeon]